MIYEYAGFLFEITEDNIVVPLPNQHKAAYKDKHRRNAIICYLLTRKKRKRKINE